jgi:uncharacterized protein
MTKANRAVFIDTNVFVALFNKDDSLHKKATEIWHDLREGNALLHTSYFVISETLTVLRLRAGKGTALKFGRTIFEQTKALHLIPTNEQRAKSAYEIFTDVPVKNFSFVDATIIATAHEQNLEVISFDKNLLKNIKK